MKKIFMLVLTSTIISVSLGQVKKDTCPCFIPQTEQIKPTTAPKPPRPWRWVEEKNQPKGRIVNSFNDSIVVEDYTGITSLPAVVTNIPERFFPPVVSNLKEVDGSFNRHITLKRMPLPLKPYCYHHHENYDWLGWLFLAAMVALIAYLLTRKKHDTTPVTIHNNIPPAPPAPAAHNSKATAPAVDLKELCKDAASTGSTVVVFADGGFKVVPPAPAKEKEKPAEEKKDQQ